MELHQKIAYHRDRMAIEIRRHLKNSKLEAGGRTWTFSNACPSGAWDWCVPGAHPDVWVYATPWWELADGLPVTICTGTADDGLYSDSLSLPFTGIVDWDAHRYLELMREFLYRIGT